MKKFIVSFFVTFLILVGSATSYLYFNQVELTLQTRPLKSHEEYDFDASHQKMVYNRPDGAKIHTVYFKAKEPKGVVLFCHGRGYNLSKGFEYLGKEFVDRGYDTLVYDYRGFGKSTGSLEEKAMLEDGVFLYQELLKKYPENKITVYGRSLGAAFATYIAAHTNPRILILESPFVSIAHIGKCFYPFVPTALLKAISKYPLDNQHWLKKCCSPVVLFHGTADKLIPCKSSKILYDTVKEHQDITFHEIEKATHSSIKNSDEYNRLMQQYL